METFKQDITYALRQMSRNLGFTLAVIFILSLGIGANTAVFSVASQVLLHSLPFNDAGRLVHIRYGSPSLDTETILYSVPEFKDFQSQVKTFTDLLEYHSMSFILVGKGDPDRVQVGVVSANGFSLLGVRPILGRDFRPDDEKKGAQAVMLLTYPYWKNSMGGDPSVVGKTLRMNGQPITIIGVLPPLPEYPGRNDVYMPTESCRYRRALGGPTTRNARMLSIFGRVKPGVSLAQAQAEIATIEARMHKEYPAFYPKVTDHVTIVPIREEMVGGFRPTLLILLGTAALVLLLTCANVGILYSVHLLSRRRELVVRASLGASRGRLIRQLLTEGMLLSVLGGLAGLGIATIGTRPLALYAQRFTPLAAGAGIDDRVLLFTLAVSVLTSLLFGLVPAFQMARQDLVGVLKEGTGRATVGASRHRFRNALILSQVAISFVLLIAAGLAIRSSLKLSRVDPGFPMANLLSMSINLPFTKYQNGNQIAAFYQSLYARVGALPGVVSVGAASSVPMTGEGFTPSFFRVDKPTSPGQMEPRADQRTVSLNYFKTVGIQLLRGRSFLPTDTIQTTPVTVITLSMAKRYWPGEDPIGKKVQLSNFGSPATIVGIVSDTRQKGLSSEPSDAFYLPFRQMGGIDMSFFVRTTTNPLPLVPSIRQAVRSIDPDQPIDEVETLEQVRDRVMAPVRITTTLLGLFAAVAFSIMVAGISCAVAIGVSERRQEIGVRSALGARRIDLLGLVLRQGVLLVLAGVLLGTGLALAAGRFLSSILFGVEATDPATYVLVALSILLISGVACLVPARRATRIEPSAVLRG